ncbi:ThuA domain-containing protein [Curtobacterium sp. MCLR17_007]|uniref:ThuA domain-containing protein n=1 Tax=Curtobacterium sp. MCLR17_007 TaxID=2175648 RepID=UPI0015E878D0|nr:ThuA domain-containing protein [Curtobacterium sp. MCLR17_007]WIB60445.1 ThuA domain-containing protein [Curtobacterium sp. MCLR17_007]
MFTSRTSDRRPQARLWTGNGSFQDEYHDFDSTSAHIAAILEAVGVEVLTEPIDQAIATEPHADLILVNTAKRRPASRESDALVNARLADMLHSSTPLLAFHVSATAFAEVPAWEQLLGGRWVAEQTWHPPIGPARIEPTEAGTELRAPARTFSLFDERYTDLRVSPWTRILAEHEQDGNRHPVVWTHEFRGLRTAYDGLGHDLRSYESDEHIQLIQAIVRWLLPDFSLSET